ncbi:hypothetical protein HX823_10775 [Pseudomonas sp. P7759]|uniref:hypothetical protein n=1 Tax=Pseudomonas sp. P7759 TaxID=2738831 RepID=UPI0015A183F7|nr:hypothetical protein [Pseudomonas sp. P7759]NWC74564.1 hypothetical protein [Pseudomonas sp. P7759]
MATRRTLKKAKGTLTASINGKANFVANAVYLTHENGLTRIVGVDEDSASLLRIIQIDMVAHIPYGEHDFPGDHIRALIGGGNTAPSHYLTSSGRVTVDFDHKTGRYEGQFKLTAQNIFPPKNIIEVEGAFAIHTGPTAKK